MNVGNTQTGLQRRFSEFFGKIADFSFHCFHEADNFIQFEKQESTFSRLIHNCTEIFTLPQFNFGHFQSTHV